MSYPMPDPPPPIKAATPRRTSVYIALLAAALVVASVVAAALALNRDSGTSPNRANGLSPAVSTAGSPSPSPDEADRVKAIIADAHSGRYFSNNFQDTYPAAAEPAFVRGMIHRTPQMSDRFFACVLSYSETHESMPDLITHHRDRARLGVKAAAACIDYYAS